MQEYAEYEKLMIESCQLLTLARHHRQSKLANKSHEHVVIVTQYGLKEGDKEATINSRRAEVVAKRYDESTKLIPTITPKVKSNYEKLVDAGLLPAYPDHKTMQGASSSMIMSAQRLWEEKHGPLSKYMEPC